MINKIFKEVVTIRKELQTIRKCLESNSQTVTLKGDPEKIFSKVNQLSVDKNEKECGEYIKKAIDATIHDTLQ